MYSIEVKGVSVKATIDQKERYGEIILLLKKAFEKVRVDFKKDLQLTDIMVYNFKGENKKTKQSLTQRPRKISLILLMIYS